MTGLDLASRFEAELESLPFEHVGIAVSGGSDSMALLALCAAYAKLNKRACSAVTVNHGLRPEAESEAKMVAQFCAANGIAHDVLRWDGTASDGNLQAAARQARYGLIAKWAIGRGVDMICLAHTQDDQAETFLMRLARKSGSDGLRSMARDFEREGARWTRPLLWATRADLQNHLKNRGISWADDRSNEDLRFERVKARKALELLAPLGIGAEELASVAANLAEENAALREAVVAAFSGLVHERCGALSFDAEGYRAVPNTLARRFLSAALRWLNPAPYPPRSQALKTFHDAISRSETATLAGVIGWHNEGKIWLAREWQGATDPRWSISPLESGEEIRTLGEIGITQIEDWRAFGLPRRVILALPAVWQGESLVSLPFFTPEKRYNTSLLSPSFNNWLSDH